MNLTGNCLVDLTKISHLTRLKRLWLDDNLLCNIVFRGLSSLESLSISQNRVEKLNDMSDLKKLVYLDLSGNRLNGMISHIISIFSLYDVFHHIACRIVCP